MYTYRQILKQALRIASRHPRLWLFGFFVTLLGSAGELEFLLSSYGLGGQGVLLAFWRGLLSGGIFSLAGFQGALKVLTSNPVYLFILGLIFIFVLGFSLLLVWLITVSQTALISQTILLSRGKNLNWQEGFSLGLLKFWPVLGLNFILRFAAWFLFGLAGLLAIFNLPGAPISSLIIFDIFLILILVVSFISKYAICGVVLKDWRLIEAIKLAWSLFTKNWLLSLELAVILFLIYFLTNLILTFFLGLIFIYALKVYSSFVFGLSLISLFLFFTFLISQVILTIFHWATWTIVFEIISVKKSSLSSQIKRIFKSAIS
jgi:hypothetical protein